jgi:hypothetical protein
MVGTKNFHLLHDIMYQPSAASSPSQQQSAVSVQIIIFVVCCRIAGLQTATQTATELITISNYGGSGNVNKLSPSQ